MSCTIQSTRPVDEINWEGAYNTIIQIFTFFSSSPNPMFSWTYQGIPIVAKNSGSDELNFENFRFRGAMNQELYITKVTQHSGGIFRCSAYNDFGGGSTFKEGSLAVYCKFPQFHKFFFQFQLFIFVLLLDNLFHICDAPSKNRGTK